MTNTRNKTAVPVDEVGSSELPKERYEQDDSSKKFLEQVRENPKGLERYEEALQEIRAHQVSLAEIRRAKSYTQETIGELLNMDQSEVSRLEKRSDMLLSTLRKFIEAAGGELELIATFPDQQPVRLAIKPTLVSDNNSDENSHA